MNQIMCCDWLPQWATDGAILPTQDNPHKKNFPYYDKSFIDQACTVKMARYWPPSFFACLWALTSSRSINTQKKNLVNIQPSWPYTWSVTHVSYIIDSYMYCSAKTRLLWLSTLQCLLSTLCLDWLSLSLGHMLHLVELMSILILILSQILEM